MAKEVLGKITCPHCGNQDATVHRQGNKSAKLYYRCYDGPMGACGTVQITLEGGQAWIEQNMRPLTNVELDEAEHEAAELAREEQRKAAKVDKSNGFLDAFFGGEGE